MKTRTTGTLSEVNERVLIALSKLHYLTIDQLVRFLRYSPTSTDWLRRSMKKELVEKNYLYEQSLPRRESTGRNPLIYALSQKGVTHLQRLGFEVFDAAEREASFLYLEHSLRVADVLIAASLLPDLVPGITLNDYKHDRWLQRYPVKVSVAGKQVSVIPDAWIDFGVSPPYGNEGERVCVCIELDRGTVDTNPFKTKIFNLCLFADGPYQAAFNTTSLTVAFLASVNTADRRVQQMKEWTIQQLTSSKKQGFTELFLFAPLPPGTIEPLTLFTSPVFGTLDNTPVALIEKVM